MVPQHQPISIYFCLLKRHQVLFACSVNQKVYGATLLNKYSI